jgi:hypothetical protein
MTEFDVFLSHNSKDKPAVRELARRLSERNIHVWLDEDQLIPGRNWQPLLEKGIQRSSTGVVVVGRDGLGPWENEEMQALLRQAANSGKPIIPVLLPGAESTPELPLFLSNRGIVDSTATTRDSRFNRQGIVDSTATTGGIDGSGRLVGAGAGDFWVSGIARRCQRGPGKEFAVRSRSRFEPSEARGGMPARDLGRDRAMGSYQPTR